MRQIVKKAMSSKRSKIDSGSLESRRALAQNHAENLQLLLSLRRSGLRSESRITHNRMEIDNSIADHAPDIVEHIQEEEKNDILDDEESHRDAGSSESEEDYPVSDSIEVLQALQLSPDIVQHDAEANLPIIVSKSFEMMQTMKEWTAPEDSQQRLHNFSTTTKGEYAHMLIDFVQDTKLNSKQQANLVSIILAATSEQYGLNLPLVTTRSGATQLSAAPYCRNEQFNRLQPFDICKKACCVFVGPLSEHVLCPKCSYPRFTKCTYRSCKGVAYIDCPHQLSTRTPRMRIYYNLLIPLITELIREPGFLLALNFKQRKLNPHLLPYQDLLDGKTALDHLRSMREKYEQYKAQNSEHQSFIEVSLLLGVFYDGVQIYKSKHSNCSPLLVTILNLPPSFRNKPGIGIFLSTIFTSAPSSPPERFLFEECLVPELLELYKGIPFQNEDSSYFVQARLISYVFDTKEVGHMLNCQCTGSYAGCPFCRGIPGVKFEGLNQMTYPGHRVLLQMDHLFRSYGQSRTCCPNGMYYTFEVRKITSEGDDGKRTSKDAKVYNHSTLAIGASTAPLTVNTRNIAPCCGAELFRNTLTALRSRPVRLICHHNVYLAEAVANGLYFHHCDYRSVQPYTAKTNAEVKHAAAVANNAVLVKDKVHDGVKGNHFFSRLPYCDIIHFSYDPAHQCGNSVAYLLGAWDEKSDRTNNMLLSEGNRALCKKMDSHPSLWRDFTTKDNSLQRPWAIPEQSKSLIEACMRCLRVPIGHSQDFEVKDIFTYTGYLKLHGKIQIYLTIMPLINYLCNFSAPYAAFNMFLHEDAKELFSPCQRNEQYIRNNLYYKVVETTAAHEGLFPVSESTNVHHQIIDIVQHIPNAGPLQSFWTLPGERVVSHVKKQMVIGGASYELPSIRNYNREEGVQWRAAYGFSAEDLERRGKDTGSIYSFYHTSLEEGRMVYDPFKTLSLNPVPRRDNKKGMETIEECDNFLTTIIQEIRKRCADEATAIDKSGVYRIFKAFSKHKFDRTLGRWRFAHWVTSLSNFYNCHSDDLGEQDQEILHQLSPFLMSDPNDPRTCADGFVLQKDIVLLKELLAAMEFHTMLYSKSLIHGKKFTSRGVTCREIDHCRINSIGGETRRSPVNPKNFLANNWSQKLHFSSWIKFRIKSYNNVNDFGSTTAYQGRQVELYDLFGFAQLNFFFTLHIPSDGVINGLSLASITARNVAYAPGNHLPLVSCDDSKSYDHLHQYVMVDNIISTPILVLPLDSAKKPFPEEYVSAHLDNHYSTKRFSEVSNLALIELDPSRNILTSSV